MQCSVVWVVITLYIGSSTVFLNAQALLLSSPHFKLTTSVVRASSGGKGALIFTFRGIQAFYRRGFSAWSLASRSIGRHGHLNNCTLIEFGRILPAPKVKNLQKKSFLKVAKRP